MTRGNPSPQVEALNLSMPARDGRPILDSRRQITKAAST